MAFAHAKMTTDAHSIAKELDLGCTLAKAWL